MATKAAMRIEMTAGILSHDRLRFSVLGKLRNRVGIAKIPQYHIKQSLLSDRDPRAAWAASNWPPTAKTAKRMVPNERTSRPMGPKRM